MGLLQKLFNLFKKEEFSLDCELILDHDPVWAGDGYFCSKCGIEFIIKPMQSGEDSSDKMNKIDKFKGKIFEIIQEVLNIEGIDKEDIKERIFRKIEDINL